MRVIMNAILMLVLLVSLGVVPQGKAAAQDQYNSAGVKETAGSDSVTLQPDDASGESGAPGDEQDVPQDSTAPADEYSGFTRVERIRAKQKKLMAENAAREKQEKLAAAPALNEPATFTQAAGGVKTQLDQSISQLNDLRKTIAAEKVPMSRKLSGLESELVQLRLDYQQASRLLDGRTLDLSNLRSEIKTRKDEAAYLSNLLAEYIRNFESNLHISELQLYSKDVENAKLAPENSNLSQDDIYKAQTDLIATSINRLNDALGGVRFNGKAIASTGLVKTGNIILLGPSAFFRSEDGAIVGTLEQRLGSMEPAIIEYGTPEDKTAATQVLTSGEGQIPFDPTMGNAHKVESTKESLLEHIKLGGPIMVPILSLGAASMLVALFKLFTLMMLRKPSNRKLKILLGAVSRWDRGEAINAAKSIGGPIGKMLLVAVENMDAPIELIEEVMHEVVLNTKIKVQGLLPFIALTATCGPLLGLLGTVTGIITTFGLITVFGSGDPKTLSGGISEALVGTEYGLYVAIPSLLLHAFLSRKSRGFIDQMEKTGVALINQISKARLNAMKTPMETMTDDAGGVNGMRKWMR